jgi:hypothetical protein
MTYDRPFLVKKVAMMRTKGKSTRNILEYLQETMGLGHTVSYEVLKEAQQMLVKQMNKDIKVSLAEAITQLEELFEEGNHKTKVEVRKELNKLIGLYAAEKIDVTTGGESINKIEISIIKKNGENS